MATVTICDVCGRGGRILIGDRILCPLCDFFYESQQLEFFGEADNWATYRAISRGREIVGLLKPPSPGQTPT